MNIDSENKLTIPKTTKNDKGSVRVPKVDKARPIEAKERGWQYIVLFIASVEMVLVALSNMSKPISAGIYLLFMAWFINIIFNINNGKSISTYNLRFATMFALIFIGLFVIGLVVALSSLSS